MSDFQDQWVAETLQGAWPSPYQNDDCNFVDFDGAFDQGDSRDHAGEAGGDELTLPLDFYGRGIVSFQIARAHALIFPAGLGAACAGILEAAFTPEAGGQVTEGGGGNERVAFRLDRSRNGFNKALRVLVSSSDDQSRTPFAHLFFEGGGEMAEIAEIRERLDKLERTMMEVLIFLGLEGAAEALRGARRKDATDE